MESLLRVFINCLIFWLFNLFIKFVCYLFVNGIICLWKFIFVFDNDNKFVCLLVGFVFVVIRFFVNNDFIVWDIVDLFICVILYNCLVVYLLYWVRFVIICYCGMVKLNCFWYSLLNCLFICIVILVNE